MHTNTESGITRRQARLERINAAGRPSVPLFYHHTTGRASARSLLRNHRIALFKSRGLKRGTYISDMTGLTYWEQRKVMPPCRATVAKPSRCGGFNRYSNGVLAYPHSL